MREHGQYGSCVPNKQTSIKIDMLGERGVIQALWPRKQKGETISRRDTTVVDLSFACPIFYMWSHSTDNTSIFLSLKVLNNFERTSSCLLQRCISMESEMQLLVKPTGCKSLSDFGERVRKGYDKQRVKREMWGSEQRMDELEYEWMKVKWDEKVRRCAPGPGTRRWARKLSRVESLLSPPWKKK